MKQGKRLRAALGALTVAMLTVAMLAPVGPATAGNGSGNGQGQGNGHVKDKDKGPVQGQGSGQAKDKSEAKAKDKAKAKAKDKAKDKDKDKVKSGAKDKEAGDKHADTQRPAGATDEDQEGDAEHEGVQAPTDAVAADKGTKHAAMQACKKGGWRELQREDGTRFRNQGGCVSHAARGGVPAAVVPAATTLFAVSLDLVSCDATATLADFDPATTYVGTLVIDTVVAPPAPSITTDALGDALITLGTFAPLQTLNLTVDGISSGDVIVGCSEGPIDPIAIDPTDPID